MANQQDVVVQTVGLTKTFRDFWLREKVTAVKDLNIAVERGEVYGLLGPNGSGKSTTLKMILGLMFPTAGRLAIFGKGPRDVATKRRLGFLPEESYLYPFLNAHETLDYYGRLFHQDRAERKRRTGMLLDMVGLSGAAYRRVGEYSKGMQRRIGMAQALINDPDLLILDEPTSGMDPLAARQFKDLIGELARRGKTIVLSSHLLADMEDLCDRVAILFAGQLRSQGTLDELLARRSLTQITTERLDNETQSQLMAVLARAGKEVLSVETPKDKLETLFLRIIHDAQRQRTTLQTAVNTGQLAEFLRAAPDQPQRQVLEELLAPAASPPPAEPQGISAQPGQTDEAAAQTAPEAPVSQEVLTQLTEGEDQQSHTAQPASPESDLPVQADQAVLDELLGKDEKNDGRA